MSYAIDHDLHLHSQLSACSSDPLQTAQAILDYAVENGMHTVCLTDHYWDDLVPGASDWYAPQNFDHIRKSRPLPQHERCRFLFGCETDMDHHLRIGIPKERYDDFDFIIVPISHLHMRGFTWLPGEGDTVEARAALLMKRFDAFLDAGLPYRKTGLAHFTCDLMMQEEKRYLQVIGSIPDDAYAVRFARCAELGCGIELNVGLDEMLDGDAREVILRPYRIARAQGCKFYLGSDAHHPNAFPRAIRRFELVTEYLGLTEEDKFHLPE